MPIERQHKTKPNVCNVIERALLRVALQLVQSNTDSLLRAANDTDEEMKEKHTENTYELQVIPPGSVA